MCTGNLNPFTSNNILTRTLGATLTFGASEMGRSAYQAMKPPPTPAVPQLPNAPQMERAPTVDVPKRKKVSGPVTPSPTSTTLTGPLGIDPAQLVLGRNLLLGQ